MTTILICGFILILAFALALSAYLTFFRMKLVNAFAQGITFIALTTVNSIVTFLLAIFIITLAF